MEFAKKDVYTMEDLLGIMEILRSENGCPWDREQTHESIKPNFVEEVYEVVEAIDKKSDDMLKEELGDVLLQVVFHAQMAKEEGRFDIDDVTSGICKKLILRHPHIFGDAVADTSEQVLKNWDEIKKVKKGQKTTTDAMRSVTAAFPALMRAQKIQKKAKKVGFDWNDYEGALSKLAEEIGEVRQAAQQGDGEHIEEEVGDMFFAMVNIARFFDVDAELALQKACEKFINRFFYVENNAQVCYSKKIEELTLDEADFLWEECKKRERRVERK